MEKKEMCRKLSGKN
ncbi:hypothetical protein L345_06891 [Ophiophagus hannah]|uniref:Uncharacterized protein n=1 Tax=Ophiophagus hannah TaxID=8665 RepID=V8P081_OPHHA|nr:hypothetical protein L345_06891 [Ophiophagus hannah]